MIGEFLRRLAYYFRRQRFDAELDEEIQHHRSLMQGAGQETRKFGSVTRWKEESRDMWNWVFIEQFFQDVRYATRNMLRNKIFTGLAVLSLALGIGANAAIFSFMDAILLRSLPVYDPASLVTLNWRSTAQPFPRGSKGPATTMFSMTGSTYSDSKSGMIAPIFPYPAFELLRKQDSVFSSVFGFCSAQRLNILIKGQADIAGGEYVSGEYFTGLGLPPAAGRLTTSEDDRPGAPPVAVISYAFSQSRFGSPENAAGQSVLINNIPFTIAGVAPPGFFGTDPAVAPDVYLPIHTNLLLQPNSKALYPDQNYYWVEMMARLRPGVTMRQALATAGPVFHQWVDTTAQTDLQRANLPQLALADGAGGLDTLRRQYSQPVLVLMTLVMLILVIACANLANLLLSRSLARRREIALRLSVGAGRFRIVRQMLTESLVLASMGGLAGVAFGFWGINALTQLLSKGDRPFTLHPGLNWHVLGVSATLSLLTGLLFGLAPALQATRVDVMPSLKLIGNNQTRSRFRLSFSPSIGSALIVSQIALSLLILVAAGLFARTLGNVQSIELGFNRENLLLFQLNAQQAGHRYPEIASFYDDLRRQFGAIPGVRGVSHSHTALIKAGTGLPIKLRGVEVPGDTRLLFVGAEFFAALQILMRRGRDFEERDSADPGVAVVSEKFARANFGDEDPIGKHMLFDVAMPVDLQVVGVVTDAHYGPLKRDIPPVVYLPYRLESNFRPIGQAVFAVRTASNPLAYLSAIREIVRRVDARVPLTNIETQADEVDQQLNQEITFAKLCAAFAILALAIACVGLYGTMSYRIARCTSEIGIRMALGARRTQVMWMVLREISLLAAIGLTLGLFGAAALSKFIESFLFKMKASDPQALGVAVAALLGALLVAAYIPARRASRIDPIIALRHE